MYYIRIHIGGNMKFYKISTIFLSLLCLVLIICLFQKNDNEILASNNLVTNNKNNALTMMLETDVDSNEYEIASSNEWPQEGYIFNAEMSACERGGKLSWDSVNNRVVMASGSAAKCYVYFDMYTSVKITNVITSNITNNSITLTVEANSGESQIATYYFSSNDGVSYEESTSNTYTFNNLEQGVEYNFKVYAVDTNGMSSNIYTLSASTTSTVYLADYIKNVVYTGTDGDNGLYYHDGSGTYTNADQEAGDNSYRYSGANPNNYVCFGSDAETCPNDNLYRIIGVFGDQVKLIKYDYTNIDMLNTDGADSSNVSGWSLGYYKGNMEGTLIRNYYWNTSSSNVWSESNLNTVNLNRNYILYLYQNNLKWLNMIEKSEWQIGGNIYQNIQNNIVKVVYENEIVTPASNQIYTSQIGLMYVSDYGYAASPENWTTNLALYNNDTNRNNNWLYMGIYEWTITKRSDSGMRSYRILSDGSVNYSIVNEDRGTVRPVFYLKSNVAITNGDGSSTNPYKLSI